MSTVEENGDDKTMIMAPPALKNMPAPKARLVCVDTSVLQNDSGAEIALIGTEVTIGRGRENTVALKAEGISRVHARVFTAGDVWGIEDVGSTNGVRVNNSKVTQAWLKSGDTVAIGRVCYKFMVDAPPEHKEEATAHQIDLGDDKTMVMRPAAKPSPAPAAARPKPAQPAAAPRAAPKTAAGRRVASPAVKSGSNMLLWVVLVAGIVLLGVAVVLML